MAHQLAPYGLRFGSLSEQTELFQQRTRLKTLATFKKNLKSYLISFASILPHDSRVIRIQAEIRHIAWHLSYYPLHYVCPLVVQFALTLSFSSWH